MSGTGETAARIELEELPGRYTVTFKSTPSWPIAETLGLEGREVRTEGGSPVKVCEVLEPFLIRANIRAHRSQDMAQRQIDSANWYLIEKQRNFIENRKKAVQSEAFNMHAVAQGTRQGLLMDLLRDLAKIKGRAHLARRRAKQLVKRRRAKQKPGAPTTKIEGKPSGNRR